MDSLTHIVLGACIGEAFLDKKIGKQALLLGAITQSVPDIDFISAFWLDPASALLAHRGFTHSFLFAIAATFFLSLVAERWHRPHNISLKKWNIFFGTEMLVHIVLDANNSYGTGWFEPFSHYRVSFNTLFVADPFFSIWPFIGFMALLILKRKDKRRMRFAWGGIILCSLYMLLGIANKISMDHTIKNIAHKQQISFKRSFITPTVMNNQLWYAVLEADSGYYIGYRSVYDTRPDIDFNFFPCNESLLDTVSDKEDLQKLIRFSKGFYTVDTGRILVFNDLRFGQIMGWNDPRAPFVFHYFLLHPRENKLVVQRGRFASWNKEAFVSLLRRIKGN